MHECCDNKHTSFLVHTPMHIHQACAAVGRVLGRCKYDDKSVKVTKEIDSYSMCWVDVNMGRCKACAAVEHVLGRASTLQPN